MGKYPNRLEIVFIVILSIMLSTGIAMGMGSTPRVPQIKIEGQEARLSPMMIGVGSIFMKIENSGNGDDTLLNAKVTIPGTITELHDVKEGKMTKKNKIRIPAKDIVELKPRSLHIMVFKMPGSIKEGNEITLQLTFEKSGEKQVRVKFIKGSDAGMQHNH